MGIVSEWSGGRDLNPHNGVGSAESCRWTTTAKSVHPTGFKPASPAEVHLTRSFLAFSTSAFAGPGIAPGIIRGDSRSLRVIFCDSSHKRKRIF